MVLAYFLGFFVFVVLVSNLEYRVLFNPLYTTPLLMMLAGAWFVAAGLDDRIADIDKQVIFEENPIRFRTARLGTEVMKSLARNRHLAHPPSTL